MPKGNPNGLRVPLPEGWVTMSKAAEALGITRRELWEKVDSGEVRAYREFHVKSRTFYGFRKSDLNI